MNPALAAEIAAHDDALARRGLDIWIGAEPTFTDRRSQDPWWLGQAEGGDKERRASALLLALAPRLAGPVRLMRVRGRQYPGEAAPRFCLGALFRRRGAPAKAAPEAAGLDGPPAPPPTPGTPSSETPGPLPSTRRRGRSPKRSLYPLPYDSS
jgi:uncharacterized protein (DUF2126 family)